MKYFYTYSITNIITGMQYIGKRQSTVKPVNDIGIKYFSSSNDSEFMEDQRENPRHYKYEVIKTFSSAKEQAEYEILLHEKYDVGKNPMFYNKVKQTSAKFDTTGFKRSTKSKDEQSKRMTGKKYSKERVAKSKAGQVKAWKDPIIRERIMKTLQSDEYRENMKNIVSGRKKTTEQKENSSKAAYARWARQKNQKA